MAQSFENALAAAKKYEDSERIAGGKPGILRFIIECQVQLGDIDGALSTLTLLRDTKEQRADGIKDEFELSYAVRAVGRELAKNGRIKEALDLAKLLMHDSYQAEVYKEIARGQIETGPLRAALDWIDKLDQPFLKAFALAGAAEGLAHRAEKPQPPAKKK
jgi:hypothetical protein